MKAAHHKNLTEKTVANRESEREREDTTSRQGKQWKTEFDRIKFHNENSVLLMKTSLGPRCLHNMLTSFTLNRRISFCASSFFDPMEKFN